MKYRDVMRVKGEGNHETIVRYLLGTLPERDQAGLEQEYFRDDQVFEHVLAVEDDLVHEYAQDALTGDERRRVEEQLLRMPEGQQRVARARELLAALPAARAARSSAGRRSFAWLAAAAAVHLALIVGWLAHGRNRAPAERAQVAAAPSALPGEAEQKAPSVVAPVAPLAPVASPPAARTARVAVLALAPGLSRADAPTRRVTAAPGTSALRLMLSVPGNPPRSIYRAVLVSADGAELWSGAVTAAAAGRLAVEIPAGRVPEGDHELVLSAIAGGRWEEVAATRTA